MPTAASSLYHPPYPLTLDRAPLYLLAHLHRSPNYITALSFAPYSLLFQSIFFYFLFSFVTFSPLWILI